MLNKIIDIAIQGRLLVVLSLFGILIGAAILLPRLNLDAFPDVTNVQVSINTEARGLGAEEVEQLITYPIEAVMYSMPDFIVEAFNSPFITYDAKIFPIVESSQPGTIIGKFFSAAAYILESLMSIS